MTQLFRRDSTPSFRNASAVRNFSPKLKAEYFNLHIFGHISEKVTYRVRQRLNVWGNAEDPFKATDWLCVSWQAIVAQICNSPLSVGFQDKFAYNIAWSGHFFPWWETIWSLNFVEDTDRRMVNYLALGNHLAFRNVAVDVDVFNRAGFGQKNFFFTDYSIISKIIWSIGKWNICTKFGYESNDEGNVDAEGKPYDRVIMPGTRYFYGGFGFEYFPMGNDKVRLHAAYFSNNYDNIHNIQVGVKWRFDVIK